METQFVKYLQAEKRYSLYTVKAYRTDISMFFRYAFPEQKPAEWNRYSEINSQVIRGWASSMIESGWTSRSVNRKITALNTFYKYLIREGLSTENPVYKVFKPKVKKVLPKFVDAEQLVDFLDDSFKSIKYEQIRDIISLEVLYSTGMRSAELINLKIEDIDFGRNTIKVLGKGNKERLIPMLPVLADRLKIYIEFRKRFFPEAKNNFLFLTSKGRQIYAKLLYLAIKKQLTQAGFTGRRSPHVMRHSFATHLLNAGADLNAVKEMLGHANLAATQVYTHNTFEKLKKTHNKAHPRASSN